MKKLIFFPEESKICFVAGYFDCSLTVPEQESWMDSNIGFLSDAARVHPSDVQVDYITEGRYKYQWVFYAQVLASKVPSNTSVVDGLTMRKWLTG